MGGCLLRTILCLVLTLIFAVIGYIALGNFADYVFEVETARAEFEPASKVRALEHDKEQAERIATVGIGGAVLFFIATLWFGIAGALRYSSQKQELEERRHQELVAAARQGYAPRPPMSVPQDDIEPYSLKIKHEPDRYFLDAERLYRAGELDKAITLLELSDWPKAKIVLKNLREIKQGKGAK